MQNLLILDLINKTEVLVVVQALIKQLLFVLLQGITVLIQLIQIKLSALLQNLQLFFQVSNAKNTVDTFGIYPFFTSEVSQDLNTKFSSFYFKPFVFAHVDLVLNYKTQRFSFPHLFFHIYS